MPTIQNRSSPIWYQLWLDVRHIPIAIYRILLNGPYMLITLGMAIDGLFIIIKLIHNLFLKVKLFNFIKLLNVVLILKVLTIFYS